MDGVAMNGQDPTKLREPRGASQINDERALRQKAQEAIKNGRLPAMDARRTWGGPGNGATTCSVCGEAVKAGEMELEIEYRRDGRTDGLDHYHFHVRCFAAWECESRSHLAHGTITNGWV
jgi:hypothetical protein